ncbi:transglutaminaseTgpA domain-containing protein [Pseudohongiella sp. O18]|uniref:transglutaminase family protein n=1 Tax=Pseudohongiella sp. O18 TaxID=2904248 RepID=UPI001F2AB2F1|nr:DUF3488 and transglutaminase-like domain-containing protein [Pseudohongiella sp. O18]
MDMNTQAAGAQPNQADLVIPATLMAAIMLILPPLQAQPWWLVLPCLICLILRWPLFAFALLFGAMTYADSWLVAAYYLGLSLLLLMRMHSNKQASSLLLFGSAVRQVLLAVPIFAVLLVLLIAAGARWSDRSNVNSAATGVGETMTPGAVSELVNDRDLAMRVRFTESAASAQLEASDLYWRGLVLEDFDGRTWSRRIPMQLTLDPIPGDVPLQDRLQYLVALEPSWRFWLYGLHQAYTMLPQTYRDERGILVTDIMVRQRLRYPVTSIPPPPELQLDRRTRERNLALPDDSNPRTRQWINEFRSQYIDDRSFTGALLQRFNEQEYFYTLTPPITSEHSVDDFMFDTRQGYCEHYAGAMTFMLRAAGIPARVVTGYQGGQYNPITGHWSVYEYNAHAWVEAWYPDIGWQRLDPTAAIAPERIELGMDAWLSSLGSEARSELDTETRIRLTLAEIPGFQSVRSALDALAFGWSLSIYDNEGNLRTEDASDWLEQQGLGNLPLWLLALLLVAVGIRAMWGSNLRRQRQSPAVRSYLRLNARLQKKGFGRKPGETIKAHLERVGKNQPENLDQWRNLGIMLSDAEYGHQDLAAAKYQMAELLQTLRRTSQLAN